MTQFLFATCTLVGLWALSKLVERYFYNLRHPKRLWNVYDGNTLVETVRARTYSEARTTFLWGLEDGEVRFMSAKSLVFSVVEA